MCGRFAIDKSTDDLMEEFAAIGGDLRDWRPSWNIRPTDPVATVVASRRDSASPMRRLELARWALTPGWSKTLKTRAPMFNARSEGITEKASFAAGIRSNRAIVPASGYYEWQTDPHTGTKALYRIQLPDGRTLAFAAIYSWWKDHSLPEGDPASWNLTTAILTADAVHTLKHIHDRNPVPLPAELWDDWLDPRITGTQEFVNATVAAAVPVAETLEFVQVTALTDAAAPTPV